MSPGSKYNAHALSSPSGAGAVGGFGHGKNDWCAVIGTGPDTPYDGGVTKLPVKNHL